MFYTIDDLQQTVINSYSRSGANYETVAKKLGLKKEEIITLFSTGMLSLLSSLSPDQQKNFSEGEIILGKRIKSQPRVNMKNRELLNRWHTKVYVITS